MDASFLYIVFYALFMSSGYTESANIDYNSGQNDRKIQNARDTQERQAYDPDDVMNYMIGGVNNQYSKDYSFGTNGFDPNKFTFMYTGNMGSGNGRSFIPSLSSSGMFQNSPNYKKANTNGVKNSETSTVTPYGFPEDNDKKQSFGNAVVVSPTLSKSYVVPTSPSILEPEIMPPLMMEQIPEETLTTVNMTDMFLKSPFRGRPGMLGYGSQIQVPQPHIIPNNYTSVKQEHIPEPVLSGYPDTLGTNRQTDILGNGTSYFRSTFNQNKDVLKQDISTYQNLKPLDTFVVSNPFDNNLSKGSDDNDTGISLEYQNSYQNVRPITAGYDWHGEWPGRTDSSKGQDWSSGWAKNWENKQSENKNRVAVPESVSENYTDIRKGLGSMTSELKDAEIQERKNQEKIGVILLNLWPEALTKKENDGMQSSLDVFQEFLSFLRNTNLPVGSSQTKSTTNDFDYNEMAKSWAKDVHA